MLIAIDGACKRNGKVDCISAGVAWVQTEENDLYYVSYIEEGSTSQRGEIYGLLKALKEAASTPKTEDIIIVTDSEYVYNTVMLEWCFKWEANDWLGATGDIVKNFDLWAIACKYIRAIGKERIYMQWTKGHLLAYTPTNIKKAMAEDSDALILYERITTMANILGNADTIVTKFNRERRDHDQDQVPPEVALQWVISNTTADCLAYYLINLYNDEIKQRA